VRVFPGVSVSLSSGPLSDIPGLRFRYILVNHIQLNDLAVLGRNPDKRVLKQVLRWVLAG